MPGHYRLIRLSAAVSAVNHVADLFKPVFRAALGKLVVFFPGQACLDYPASVGQGIVPILQRYLPPGHGRKIKNGRKKTGNLFVISCFVSSPITAVILL